MNDVHRLGVAAAGRLIAEGLLSPVELIRALLARIDAVDPAIRSFVTVTGASALAAAAEAERDIRAGRRRGPLHGIPFGVKDLFAAKGVATTAQSRWLADYVPARDSAVVARLRAAGAILLGKVMTHEFGIGGPSHDLAWPQARNPWNREHYTGGSSAGAGAAVAADLTPFAIGSDTSGSLRMPAAYCGLAGLKPSFGLVSRDGAFPASSMLDHCGPMARSSEDCALVLDAIAGYDPGDPGSLPVQPAGFTSGIGQGIAGLRIGILRCFNDARTVDSEAASAFEQAIRLLQGLGARLSDCPVAPLEVWDDASYVITYSDIFAVHEPTLKSHPDRYAAITRARLMMGADFKASDYINAVKIRDYLKDHYAQILENFDAVVTLCSVGPPDTLEHFSHLPPEAPRGEFICAPFSLIGVPALSVRSGFTASGFPLSLQIAGTYRDDATVLRIGDAYERAAGWSERRPLT